MVAIRLEESALDFVASALSEAGGVAAEFPRRALRDPITFAPEETNPEALEDLETGGIANQGEADAELALFLHFLKKRNGRLHSLVLDDPWSKPDDLDYAGPLPEETAIIEGRINHLYDLSTLAQELIWEYRANAVSFLKIVYVSELTVEQVRTLVENEPPDLLHTLAHSIRHIAVNAYGDETWVVVGVGHLHG